jgi:O-antigen ligase
MKRKGGGAVTRADGAAAAVPAQNGPGENFLPGWIYYAAFAVTFTVPNLVFSGRGWYDTLHIMKWCVTMAPIAIASIVAGFRLFTRGSRRVNFKLDPFALAWLVLILLVTIQPLYIKLTSASTYIKEWFFFASLFAVYMLAYNIRPRERFFRALLWGCGANAAINIVFAEIVVRSIDTGLPFVMDVPGNYVGNTAQQEMLGLWAAMAILNGVYLHVRYSDKWRSDAWSAALMSANMLLMAVNAYGLWRTTSRGAILALLVGFVVMTACFMASRAWKAVVHLACLFALVMIFFAVVVSSDRGDALVGKLTDMAVNTGTFGGRIAIWRVSNEVFLKYPMTGVGLGHYKWHFLEGQGILYSKYPDLLDSSPLYKWQYTYWAHSEYLQWLCETGLIGAALLGAVGLWWLYRFFRAFARGGSMPPESVWGAAMLFLLFFDALFSRPFHRIENAVWMSLAFAQVNAFILGDSATFARETNERVYKAFGAFIASIAVCGLVFLGGGMMGDKLILKAVYRGTSEEKMAYLAGAGRYPMSREDAYEQLANLNLSISGGPDGGETYLRGVEGLYAAFMARPNSERLFRLFERARELNNTELMMRLMPYVPPGSVSIR